MDYSALPNEGGVYIIECSANGKFYVGSAVSIRKRAQSHASRLRGGYHSSIRLQRAWDKHGSATFAVRVLELVSDIQALTTREQWWIDETDAVATGLNSKPIADSNLGSKRTAETRAKMSVASAGKRHSPESIARMRAAHANRKPWTDEMRARMSAMKSGVIMSPEARAKLRAANLGAKRSEAARAAMARAQLGKRRGPMPQSQRDAIRDGHLRRQGAPK